MLNLNVTFVFICSTVEKMISMVNKLSNKLRKELSGPNLRNCKGKENRGNTELNKMDQGKEKRGK